MEPFEQENQAGQVQLEELCSYLLKLSCLTLDLDEDRFHALIHEPENQELVQSFANDPSKKILVVDKSEETVELSLEVEYRGPTHAVLAFVKREGQGTLEDAPL